MQKPLRIALSTTLVVLLRIVRSSLMRTALFSTRELVALAHVEGLAHVQQEAGIELRVAGAAAALVRRPAHHLQQGGHLLLVGVQLLLGDGDL